MKFKRIPSPKGQKINTPTYATKGSACFDLQANIDNPIIIKAGEKIKIPSGLGISLQNQNLVAKVYPRSGLGSKKGIIISNTVGIIDSDYTLEIGLTLWNTSNEDYTINPLDRVAQMGIFPVYIPPMIEVEELEDTGRGGFGSTGV